MSDKKTATVRGRTVECSTCEGTTFTVVVREVFGHEHFCAQCDSCGMGRITSLVNASSYNDSCNKVRN